MSLTVKNSWYAEIFLKICIQNLVYREDFKNDQIKAATIDPKKITVTATINFILKPSSISWAVSVLLLSFFIYSFFFHKIKFTLFKYMMNPNNIGQSCVKIDWLDELSSVASQSEIETTNPKEYV